ncbi:MAG: hypothetical protein HOV79_32280 [Hamadaea sp.]|nr:hypothetical protein [Hamadaea sp.]
MTAPDPTPPAFRRSPDARDVAPSWAHARGVATAAAQLLTTLDEILAGIGVLSDDPDTTDNAFMLRGQVEVADHILAEVIAGPDRALRIRPEVTSTIVTIVGHDTAQDAFLLIVATAGDDDLPATVDVAMDTAGFTPVAMFRGDVSGLLLGSEPVLRISTP